MNETKGHLMKALCCLAMLVAHGALAQVQLDLGGTGSYGPLTVMSDTTIPLPPDGVLQVTTMTVAAGATLRFTPNARNTPVTIVATGDVVINGTVDLSGSPGTAGQPGVGGPGGGIGGSPSLALLCGSGNCSAPSNLGPGAVGLSGGTGGTGSYPSSGVCTVLGAGGSGGGGAVFIRSNTAIRSSTVGATITTAGGTASAILPTNALNPSNCPAGNQTRAARGSDGTIRLVAPVVEGSTLTLVAVTAAIDRLSGATAPTLQNSQGSPSPIQWGTSMAAYSAPIFTPRIVSIDSTTLPVGANSFVFTYTPAALATTVVTNVTGCPSNLSVTLSADGFITSCAGDQTTFNSVLNATTTWTCQLTPNTQSTGRLLFYATCNEP